MNDCPDIVFFMVDQLSAKWIEQPNCDAIDTPHFDRLRAMGVNFSHTFSSNPVCCPARATLATGLTTRQHGVLQNGYALDPALPTFARVLREAGYQTGAFGKVHHHPHFAGVHPDYRPYGYDVVHNTEDPRAGEWLDWVRDEHPEHFDAALSTIWAGAILELESYGPGGENLRPRIQRAREAFDFSDAPPGSSWGQYPLPFPKEVSQTEWITGHALEWIAASDRNRPMHAFVSYVQPHSPFCCPREYLDRVDESKLPEVVPAEWRDDPDGPACFEHLGSSRQCDPDTIHAARLYYYGDLIHLDEQLGKLLDTLEARGTLDRTFIVLLSDHGEMLHDHSLTGKGEFHYDACVRVPLVIAGPGVDAGRTCDAIVQLEDIFPTVLDWAGVPLPKPPTMGPYLKAEPSMYSGRSLTPLLTGNTPTDWRNAAYIESYNNITSNSPMHWAWPAPSAPTAGDTRGTRAAKTSIAVASSFAICKATPMSSVISFGILRIREFAMACAPRCSITSFSKTTRIPNETSSH